MNQLNHRLWDIVKAKSDNWQRPISHFKTKKGLIIDLGVYFSLRNGIDSEWRSASIGFSRRQSDFSVSENYHLEPDGSCTVSVGATITSTTGWARHSLHRSSSPYTKEDIFKESQPWVKSQLDQIAEWLNDPLTVRVDPYDYSKVLPA